MLRIVLKLDQLRNIGLCVKKNTKRGLKNPKFGGIYPKKWLKKSGKNLMERLRVKLKAVGYAGVIEPFKLSKI